CSFAEASSKPTRATSGSKARWDKGAHSMSLSHSSREGRMSQTILVIDDDLDICEIVKVNLEGVGYQVSLAHDGAAGLAAARALRPDLIILDVLMPELDGWQVLDELRKETSTADLPVIVLTCKGD